MRLGAYLATSDRRQADPEKLEAGTGKQAAKTMRAVAQAWRREGEVEEMADEDVVALVREALRQCKPFNSTNVRGDTSRSTYVLSAARKRQLREAEAVAALEVEAEAAAAAAEATGAAGVAAAAAQEAQEANEAHEALAPQVVVAANMVLNTEEIDKAMEVD